MMNTVINLIPVTLKSTPSQWTSLFQTIPNGKYVRQILGYLDSAIRFSQTHFYYPYQFHGDTKLNQNSIQDLLLTEP